MRVPGLTLALALLGAAPAFAAAPADLVFVNGKVITADKAFHIASVVAVRDGRILAVGGPEVAKAYKAKAVVDLHGKVLMPGFTDSHLHIRDVSPRAVPIGEAPSIAFMQDRLREKAKALGPGQWIVGFGWDEALFAEKRNPSRWDLDAAAPDNPVMLVRNGNHSAVGNSLALKIADITRDTPDPDHGVIERDAKGEPNGIIRERTDLYRSHIPADTWADLKPGYMATMRWFTSKGITSFFSANSTIDDEPTDKGGVADPPPGLTFRRFQEMARDSGYTLPRVYAYITYPGPARMAAFPHHSGYGDEWVRLGAIGENAVDGGFTGPTAWTLADYKGQPGFRGRAQMSEDELQAMVDTSNKYGWQVGLHAIGDAAIQATVKAYDASLKKMPRTDHRWFTDHFTIMPPDATMQTMKADGIAAAQQPNFLYNLEGRYEALLDDWRLEHNNSVVTPAHKFGIFMAFGSDNLPIDPRVGLYAAVTRKGPSGRVHGPEEAIPVREAIQRYTAYGPVLSFEEKVKGTIEPGKYADLIVLDSDPLTIPPEKLLTMKVEQTYIGGKLVYDIASPDQPKLPGFDR